MQKQTHTHTHALTQKHANKQQFIEFKFENESMMKTKLNEKTRKIIKNDKMRMSTAKHTHTRIPKLQKKHAYTHTHTEFKYEYEIVCNNKK